MDFVNLDLCLLDVVSEQCYVLCYVQVTVNGVDYQPQTASPNKKHAKAMAATVALQALGEVTRSSLAVAVTALTVTSLLI